MGPSTPELPVNPFLQTSSLGTNPEHAPNMPRTACPAGSPGRQHGPGTELRGRQPPSRHPSRMLLPCLAVPRWGGAGGRGGEGGGRAVAHLRVFRCTQASSVRMAFLWSLTDSAALLSPVGVGGKDESESVPPEPGDRLDGGEFLLRLPVSSLIWKEKNPLQTPRQTPRKSSSAPRDPRGPAWRGSSRGQGEALPDARSASRAARGGLPVACARW